MNVTGESVSDEVPILPMVQVFLAWVVQAMFVNFETHVSLKGVAVIVS